MNKIFPIFYPYKKSSIELPERPIVFIGREEYLNKINDLFTKIKIVAICSFGGVGKTTLALEFIVSLKRIDSSSYVRWFNSDSREKLEFEYKRFGRLLGVNVNDNDFDFVIEEINLRLAEFKKHILFVFDNLESYDHIENYIACTPNNVKILITTRSQLEHTLIPKLDLEPFSLSEAHDYINKNLQLKVNQEIREKIIQIAKTTTSYGILPIKLEKIISYLNYYYLNDVNESLAQIVNNNYINNKVEVTLFLKLKLDEDGSLEILQYCSFLNPDFIPLDLLKQILNDDLNENKLNLNFKKLNNLSLISIIEKEDKIGLKIHRLIQEELKCFVDNNMDDQLVKQNEVVFKILVKKLNKLFKYVSNEPKTWKHNEEYYIQALNIETFNANMIEKIEIDEEVVELIDKLEHFEFHNRFNYKNLLNKLIKIYDMRKRLYGHDADHILIAKAINNIGDGYDKVNNFAKSLEYKLNAYEMRKRIHGGDDVDNIDVAESLNSIGVGYERLGNYEKAIEFKLKAFEMRKRLLKEEVDHPEIAKSLNSIGVCYAKFKNDEKALEFFVESYEMRKRLYGNDADHPDIALALNNIGVTYDKLNKSGNILDYLFKAYEMRRRIFGDVDHIHIADSLISIGSGYEREEKFEKALEFKFKAYEMYVRLLGNIDHVDIARALNNLGLVYKKLKDYERALEFYFKGYDMRKKIYANVNHSDIALSLTNIADVYECLNNEEKALEYKLKADEIKNSFL